MQIPSILSATMVQSASVFCLYYSDYYYCTSENTLQKHIQKARNRV